MIYKSLLFFVILTLTVIFVRKFRCIIVPYPFSSQCIELLILFEILKIFQGLGLVRKAGIGLGLVGESSCLITA